MKLIKAIHEEKKDVDIVASITEEPMLEVSPERKANEDAYAEVQKETDKIAKELIKEGLEEDVNETEVKAEVDNNILTNNLKKLLQDEWEAVEGYQDAITVIKANELDPDGAIVNIISDIIEEEYIHIGQLNKAMETYLQDAHKIKEGEAEAEEEIAEEPAVKATLEEPEDEIIVIEESVVEESLDPTPIPVNEVNEMLGINKIDKNEEIKHSTVPANNIAEELVNDFDPVPVKVTAEEVEQMMK